LTLPKVSVLSLGGPIAMTGSGVVSTLAGDDLISAVPQLAEEAVTSASSLRQVPGAYLHIEVLAEMAAEIVRLA
jgi:L-asparaginase/Glu-tRNA(Gln) amidotransferase subunit D